MATPLPALPSPDSLGPMGLVVLAPMAGVTDSPYRRLARSLGCPTVITEMISSEGLVRDSQETLRLADYHPEEQPVWIQIFGARPEAMAEAARWAEARGYAGVDINMGCPVKKVVKSGAGAAMMRDPEKAAVLLGAVRRAVRIPVTAKLRAGWTAEEINVVEVAQRLFDAGADGLTVHPRTRSQFYAGRADWTLILQVAGAVALPVVGNGDIRCGADALAMMEQTGCRGVMVGRAAMGDPWLPGRIKKAWQARRNGSESPVELLPSGQERYDAFVRHLDAMIDWIGSERRAVLRMRKHAVWYSRGLMGASRMRQKILGIETRAGALQCMQSLLYPANQAE